MNKAIQDVEVSQVARQIVTTLSVVSFFTLTAAIVMKFYYQIPVEQVLSFHSFDWFPYPRDVGVPISYGQHFFSDYALMHWISKSLDVTRPSFFDTPWFPITYLFFSPLTLLPYTFGLFITMVLMAVSSIGPLIVGFRKAGWSALELISGVIFVGIISAPSISAFDRGNVVALLPGLLFVYFKSVQSENELSLTLSITFACIIKPHAIIFLIALLATRQIIVLARSIATIAIVEMCGFYFGGGDVTGGIRHVLRMTKLISSLGPFHEGQSASQWVVGISTWCSRGIAVAIEGWTFENRTLISFILLLIITMLVMQTRFLPAAVRLVLLLVSFPVLIPSSPTYNSIVAIVVVALFAEMQSTKFINKCKNTWDLVPINRSWTIWVVVVIVFQLVPIPIAYRGNASLHHLFATGAFLSYTIYCCCFVVKKRISKSMDVTEIKINMSQDTLPG